MDMYIYQPSPQAYCKKACLCACLRACPQLHAAHAPCRSQTQTDTRISFTQRLNAGGTMPPSWVSLCQTAEHGPQLSDRLRHAHLFLPSWRNHTKRKQVRLLWTGWAKETCAFQKLGTLWTWCLAVTCTPGATAKHILWLWLRQTCCRLPSRG